MPCELCGSQKVWSIYAIGYVCPNIHNHFITNTYSSTNDFQSWNSDEKNN